MTEEIAKIRVKVGQIEIEYKGAASFLESGLMSLMEKVVGFHKDHKEAIPVDPAPANANGKSSAESTVELDHSTNTIATLLGAKSGPDLIIAAAACLTLVQGRDRFTRKEVLAEMQTAASFFKVTYRNNLSKYLDGLVKGDRLRLVGESTYAISSQEKNALEKKLA